MDTWKVKGENTTKNAHDVNTDINSGYLGRGDRIRTSDLGVPNAAL